MGSYRKIGLSHEMGLIDTPPFAIIPILPFLNNPKDLDPSYKMDLDLWDCFGRKKLCLITEEIRYWI